MMSWLKFLDLDKKRCKARRLSREKLLGFILGLFVWALPQYAYGLLLSDLSYHILRKETQVFSDPIKINLLKKERSFDKVWLNYQDRSYEVPFDRRKKSIEITLPPYLLSSFDLKGYKNRALVWQRSFSRTLPAEDIFPPLRFVLRYKTFRGALVFADQIPRLSADFLEPLTRENAVFLRGVCADLSTCFLYFPRFQTQESQSPLRYPLGVFMRDHSLYYYHSSAGIKWDFKSNDKQEFSFENHIFNKDKKCPKRFSDQRYYYMDFSKKKWSLSFYESESKINDSLKRQEDCRRIFREAVASRHVIHVPRDLIRELQGVEIHDYHIESFPTQIEGKPSFYVLLIKAFADHVFTQKKRPDDYVLVLDESFSVDGVLAVATHYYSPRLNVAFLPSLEDFLTEIMAPEVLVGGL